MKHFLLYITIAFAVNLVSPVYSQENRRVDNPRDNRHDDRHRPRSIKGELMQKLDQLERDFSRNLGRRDRAELQRQINDIRELIRQLPAEREVVPEPLPLPMPMNDAEFNELLNTVKKQSFKDDKVRVIRLSAGYNFYTVNQVVTLAKTAHFGDERVEIIKVLYPRIIDYHKSFQLYECLTFDSEKKKLEQIINEYDAQRPNVRDR
jgi:hypothetical protein